MSKIVSASVLSLEAVAVTLFRKKPIKPRSVAFGNKCAVVYTAPLNKRATCASALPIANTTFGSRRGPPFALRALAP